MTWLVYPIFCTVPFFFPKKVKLILNQMRQVVPQDRSIYNHRASNVAIGQTQGKKRSVHFFFPSAPWLCWLRFCLTVHESQWIVHQQCSWPSFFWIGQKPSVMSSVHLSPVAWMQQLSQGDFFQAIGPFFDGSKLQAIFPDHRSVLSVRVIEKSGHILGWILTIF